MNRTAQRLALQYPSLILRVLTALLPTLALVSMASRAEPATITLFHSDTGARAVCSDPASSEEAAALLKRLPPPMVFGAWGALQSQYDTGRIALTEYCARRYELANYVRSSTAFEPSRGATYVNSTYRWSVAFPDFWRLNDVDRGWVKLSRGMAVVGIHTLPNISGRSLEEVVDASLRGWEQHIGSRFEVISRRHLTLSNHLPAIEIVHHIGNVVVGKSRKVIAVFKDRVFLIDAETYLEAWPAFEPDFNRIIESFSVQE
jgi:hypothetical protein